MLRLVRIALYRVALLKRLLTESSLLLQIPFVLNYWCFLSLGSLYYCAVICRIIFVYAHDFTELINLSAINKDQKTDVQ